MEAELVKEKLYGKEQKGFFSSNELYSRRNCAIYMHNHGWIHTEERLIFFVIG